MYIIMKNYKGLLKILGQLSPPLGPPVHATLERPPTASYSLNSFPLFVLNNSFFFPLFLRTNILLIIFDMLPIKKLFFFRGKKKKRFYSLLLHQSRPLFATSQFAKEK